jgi:hypothetical protein
MKRIRNYAQFSGFFRAHFSGTTNFYTIKTVIHGLDRFNMRRPELSGSAWWTDTSRQRAQLPDPAASPTRRATTTSAAAGGAGAVATREAREAARAAHGEATPAAAAEAGAAAT